MSSLSAGVLRDCLRVSEDGLARLDRRVYTDPEIFELEMKWIWERQWVFVTHESQLPGPGHYVTAQIGRQPVVAMKNKAGEIGVFINACTHRGTKLCRLTKGHAKLISCPYHGWTYDTGGKLIALKEEAHGAYPPSFDKQALGLARVPCVESYRGFLFASLNPEAPPLREHLGDAVVFIDLLVDQAEHGWELLKGNCSYTYAGNWKLQAENGVDSYHATTVHANFSETMAHRRRNGSERGKTMELDHVPVASDGGFFDLGHGHVMIWRDWTNPQDRFNYAERAGIARRMGELRMKWAVTRLRNVLIYPNLLLMDQMSTQVRTIQPISVNKTKVTGYALAPIGEPREQRRHRLRVYEDFFNPSGMATPDDLSEFQFSQQGFQGRTLRWSDLSRGAMHQVAGGNRFAEELGIRPKASGAWIEDEGIFVGKYRYWLELMVRGLEEEERG